MAVPDLNDSLGYLVINTDSGSIVKVRFSNLYLNIGYLGRGKFYEC